MEVVYIFLFFIIAFLYSSVGHGGASGYIALMILINLGPSTIKQNALIFNLFVSLIAFIGFYKANYFKFSLFWPLVTLSSPFAYFGGFISLSNEIYKNILGFCLIFAIFQLIVKFKNNYKIKPMPVYIGLFLGSIIGLISGLLGIGGGIILSPILVLFSWASIKETAAISALFIFINSLAGLLGFYSNHVFELNTILFYPLIFIVMGGILGSTLGSRIFNPKILKFILIIVIFIAIIKLFQ